MLHDSLTLMQEKYLRLVLAEGHAFEERFGKVARRFFERLPMLFGLFRRVSFDLSLPAHERRLAAAALVYLAESDDFLRESAAVGVSSYIDDVWVAFEVFRRLRDAVGDDAIARSANRRARRRHSRRLGRHRRLGLGIEPRARLPGNGQRHRCYPRGGARPLPSRQNVVVGRCDR